MGWEKILRALLVGTIGFGGAFSASLFAQGPAADAPSAAVESASRPMAPQSLNFGHKFWDRENYALFAASAALSGADFAVTRANLQSGGKELNPIVRMFGTSDAGLAANFAGETAGVIGVSYFCHKTGHHRMERTIAMVNIGASAGAVGYGLTHQSASPTNAATIPAHQARAFTVRIKLGSR